MLPTNVVSFMKKVCFNVIYSSFTFYTLFFSLRILALCVIFVLLFSAFVFVSCPSGKCMRAEKDSKLNCNGWML